MNRDDLLRYGTLVPLPLVLDHPQLRSLTQLGLELRRAAARPLNEAAAEQGVTRLRLASLAGVDPNALMLVCTARRSMDPEVLKRALAALGIHWREAMARFEEAVDYRGRRAGLPLQAS